MLLLQNNVVVKEISFKENIQQILELNKKSKYPALEESIHLIGNLEEMGSIHTIGFFKNENLVQYLTVIIEDKFSYILCVNMSEDIREWSGILNAYRIFVEVSLKYGVKIAYVGYECIDEKLKRGAQMLEKYFIYK